MCAGGRPATLTRANNLQVGAPSGLTLAGRVSWVSPTTGRRQPTT